MEKGVLAMTTHRTKDRLKLMVAALVAIAVLGGILYTLTLVVG